MTVQSTCAITPVSVRAVLTDWRAQRPCWGAGQLVQHRQIRRHDVTTFLARVHYHSADEPADRLVVLRLNERSQFLFCIPRCPWCMDVSRTAAYVNVEACTDREAADPRPDDAVPLWF